MLLGLFSLWLVSGTFAQDTEPEGDYRFEQRFVQRLSWEDDPLVFRYEVVIEIERDGEYTEQLRESTTENFLSLSLRPGKYRYAVEVYNLLRQLEYTMDYVYFTVLNALQPEILTISPEAFFPKTRSPWQITITGRNIDPEALIMLRPLGAPDGQDIRPRSTTFKGETLLLTFDKKELPPGIYDVYIRNPGGLADSRGILTVHEKSEAAGEKTADTRFTRPDIIISAGYVPAVPLYGGLFRGDAFESAIFPLGFAARVGVLPLKRNWGNLGAELNASWHKLEEQKSNYTVTAHDIGLYLNLLYQLWLPNRKMALNFHLGAGINWVADFYFDYGDGKEDPLTSAYLSLDAGFTFQWRFWGPLFLETGIDFIHVFSPKDQSQPGYLRPTLSIGGQF
ncbi:hypothetical protein AGMMS49944_17310 [Spirochaetia bacterium]|nr:hypothetical protein AGMMS49944_17310 [Spirochaetia bacterium]